MTTLLRDSSRFTVFVVMAAAVFLSLVHRAHAVKFWKNSVTTGTWNTGNNWSAVSAAGADNGEVPVGGEPVRIVNTDGVARTVTYNVNAPTLGLLSIDLTGAGATTNTLSMPNANNLTAGAIFVGGYSGVGPTNGRGAISQSAGTASTGPGGDWVLGHGAGSSGTYTLSGSGAVVATQSEFIGFSGTGVFNHSAGTNTINAGAIGSLDIGANAGSMGTYNLSGTGQLISNKSVYIGDNGTGVFNQTGGSHTIQGAAHDLILGYTAGAFGTYTLSGGSVSVSNGSEFIGYAALGNVNQSGGTFNQSGGTHFVAGPLYVGGGSGTFNQTGGTFQTNSDVHTAQIIGAVGNIIVSGPGTTFTSAGSLYVGEVIDGFGSLTISGGGTVSTLGAAGGNVAFPTDSNGNAIVTGPGSTWQLTTDLKVGDLGVVDIQNQGFVNVGDELNLTSFASVNLNGGKLRVNSITGPGGVSRLNFVSGTMQLGSNRTIGGSSGDAIVASLFGAVPTITSIKSLTIEQIATLNTAVIVNGGTLTVGQLINPSLLQFQRGTLNVTNQAIAIGTGGALGNTLDLAADMTVNVTLGITNLGLVTGDGQIGGNFANSATGELRAEPGRSLKLTGANNTNAGQINLYGGMLDFTQNLTNNAGAFISGNGTLKTTTGLTNNGTANFSGLANVVGDVINSATGKIISSGGGPTTFFDDVTNNGEVRTSAGSFTVFFGATGGTGSFTGPGTANFEGDLKPGNSPGTMNFGGNVTFGAAATLEIELAGTTPGTGYDQIKVAGELSLGGTLNVVLIGLTPAAGQSFDILDWGSLTGTFSTLNLPALSGLGWNTSQLYTSGILSITTAAGVPGDYNNNGVVDAADYAVWRNNVGTTNTLPNDPIGGTIGAAQYNTWRARFGQSGGGAGANAITNSTVPEPSSGALLLITLLGTVASRRRQIDSRADSLRDSWAKVPAEDRF